MDPVTAFTLATTALQVTLWGRDAFLVCKELVKKGATQENIDRFDHSLDVADVSTTLTSHLQDIHKPDRMPPIDRKLLDLAKDCADDGFSLRKELHKLRAKPSDNRLKILLKAVETLLKSNRIKDIEDRLERHRRALESTMIARLVQKVDLHNLNQQESLRRLDETQQQLIVQLKDGRQTLRDLPSQLTKLLLGNSEKMRAEIVATQATLESSNSREHEITRDYMAKQALAIRDDLVAKDSVHKAQRALDDYNKDVLRSLWFETIDARQAQVVEAHEDTFTWILDDAPDPEPLSVSAVGSIYENTEAALKAFVSEKFVQWLKSGDGMFWITGKAGSGKSTLMKCITQDTRTKRYLDIWAAGRRLSIPSFYFYRAGTKDQRNTTGLLRALLYQILSVNQALIVPMMDHIHSRDNYEVHGIPAMVPAWSLMRLEDALRFCLDNESSKKQSASMNGEYIQCCIFIDGLDEFDDSYDRLARYLKDICALPNVKLCVSSRPVQRYYYHFASAQIQLQDLTSTDVAKIIDSRLTPHPRAAELQRQSPSRWAALISSLRSRAQGVISWVVLVIRQLHRGLDEMDDIEMLEKRLDTMPRELTELYTFLLSQTDKLHYPWASTTFTLALLPSRLSILDLVLATEAMQVTQFLRCNTAEEVRALPLVQQQYVVQKCQAAEVHVDIRCVGLLSTKRSSFSSIHNSIPLLDGWLAEWYKKIMHWHHKTAFDYIQSSTDAALMLGFEATATRTSSGRRDYTVAQSAMMVIIVFGLHYAALEDLQRAFEMHIAAFILWVGDLGILSMPLESQDIGVYDDMSIAFALQRRNSLEAFFKVVGRCLRLRPELEYSHTEWLTAIQPAEAPREQPHDDVLSKTFPPYYYHDNFMILDIVRLLIDHMYKRKDNLDFDAQDTVQLLHLLLQQKTTELQKALYNLSQRFKKAGLMDAEKCSSDSRFLAD